MSMDEAQWLSTIAAIRKMSPEQASWGVLTCNKRIREGELSIEQLMQALAAAGRNERRCMGIRRRIRETSDHITELAGLLKEYEQRLQIHSISDSEASDVCCPPEQNVLESRSRQQPGEKDHEAFTHSDDYCSIEYRGEKYSLTLSAGQIVCMLHVAYKSGKVGVSSHRIREQLKCGKVWDQFRRRGGRKFWKALIRKDEKNVFKLDLEPFVGSE